MQLSDKTGISCDNCGTSYQQDFVYYSFDIRSITVTDNRKPSLEMIHHANITFSLDICTNCYDKIKDEIIKQNSKIISNKRRVRIETVCELSGKVLVGNYTYYHVNITRVNVKTTGQPNICVGCKAQTFENDKPCIKCKGIKFLRPAILSLDDRHVEFSICEEIYKKFTETVISIRRVASQWSSKS